MILISNRRVVVCFYYRLHMRRAFTVDDTIYLFIYSFIHSFIHSFVYLFIYLFPYLFISLFIYLFIYLFVRSFVRLFVCLLTLLRALVVSKVDYCCSVLAGISGTLLQRLQSVMNADARLVFSARRSEHTIPLLRELHCSGCKFRRGSSFGCVLPLP